MLLEPNDFPEAASCWSDHQEVHFFEDARANLRAFVAIHSSGPLGIAGGGTRLLPYRAPHEALRDALRLSAAMSAKMLLSGVMAGGAKCVVIADAAHKSPALFRALADAINSLQGRFVAGADVNTGVDDLRMLARFTPYVERAGPSEDVGSVMTARGVLAAITAAVDHCLRRHSLREVSVAVQGLGKVGGELAKLLHAQGARLLLSDVDEGRAHDLAASLGAQVIAPSAVLAQRVDVLAPCAMGDVLTASTIPTLGCRVIAGSANNQLAEPHLHEELLRRGVVYVPDYVVSLGGVLAGAYPRRCAQPEGQHELAQRVGELTLEVLRKADAAGVSPSTAAAALTDERRRATHEGARGLGASALRGVVGTLWRRPWFARSVLNARAARAQASH